jgi:hypothetical protein
MPHLATTAPPIVTLVLAILVLWLSVAFGQRVMAWFRVPAERLNLVRAVVALGLGLGLLQFVPFLLGVAGVLSVTSLRIALALLALALVRDLVAVARALVDALRALRRPDGWTLALLLVLLPPTILTGLLAITPSIDADGLSYHLAVPKRWLDAGSLVYLPTYPYSNMPMGIEMLFGIGLVLGGDVTAKLLHFGVGLATAAALFAGARQLGGRLSGAAAAVLYLVGPAGALAVLGWGYLEGIIAFAMVSAVIAWIAWYQTRELGWLRCACLLAGISVSFKVTSALLPIAFGALTLFVLWDALKRGERENAVGVGEFLVLAALVVLPVLPWFVRSALLTGNPFFPLFVGLIPTRDYSPETAAVFQHYNRYFVWGSGRGGNWSLGLRQGILAGFALAAVLATAFAYFRLSTKVARAVALAMLGIVVIQVAAVGLYTRYWIPLAAVLVLPIAVWCEPLFRFPIARAALIAVAALGSAVRTRAVFSNVNNDVGGLALAGIGLQSERNFTLQHLPLFPLYERANADLPANAVVMLTYYCGGSFHIDRTTLCAEFLQDALRFTTWQDFSADVARLRVTHVLAPRSLAEGSAPPPVDLAAPTRLIRDEQDEFIGRLLRTRGRLVQGAADQGLYALDAR